MQISEKGTDKYVSKSLAPKKRHTRIKPLFSDELENQGAQEALRAREAHSRSIIETANDAYVEMDTEGLITDWNRQAELTFGWNRGEAVGRPLTETIIPPQFREAHRKGVLRFLTTGEGPVLNKRIELRALHRDGHEFPVELTVWPVRVGGVFRFNAFVHDITERHQAAEKISQLNEELRKRVAEVEAANQELEAFSYSVSHDLRAPLRAIDGFSRILMEDAAPQLTGDSLRFLNLVRENAHRMGQLIDDLLVFARLSRQPLQKQRVVTADLVHAVLEDLLCEQDHRRVVLSIHSLPECEADPNLLKQVFQNLLANAFKYTRRRDEAHVEIGACQTPLQPERAVVFFVRDNGVGFDMRYADKLFGVFQRLHRAEDYEGTGVGLAIVQRVVRRHGGRAWAEAEVDGGATFYFTLEEGSTP